MTGKPNPPKEYAKEPTGRPSKFTPERRKAIIDDISHRIPYELAAEANGICEETLYIWLNKGKEDLKNGIDSDYAFFFKEIKRTEMSKIREHVDIIADKPERWQADAWILERRWHRHFGANVQINDLNKRIDELLKLKDKDPNNPCDAEQE